MKNLKAIILILSFIVFLLWIAYRVFLSYTQPNYDEIINLNNNCKLLTHKHNEANHKLNDANNRIKELKEANYALIKACNTSAFRKAAQSTPLPKMKEA